MDLTLHRLMWLDGEDDDGDDDDMTFMVAEMVRLTTTQAYARLSSWVINPFRRVEVEVYIGAVGTIGTKWLWLH